jgi:RNA polymerase sigma-70 factor (ECF subfamily)
MHILETPAPEFEHAPGRLASGSLEDLMVRHIEGDSAAFDELYRQLSPKLFGYLLRLTRKHDQAEDLVQITFSKLHRARSSYLVGAPLLPWVFAIARRSFFDLLRRTKVRPEYLSTDGSTPEPPVQEEGLGSDVVQALEIAMGRLPTSYAEAIQLTKVTGLSISEAAEVLGTSSSAVKLRVHRGYKLLRKELENYDRDFLAVEASA